jgi:hypothetical protein
MMLLTFIILLYRLYRYIQMLLKKPIEQPTTGPNTTNPSYNIKPASSNASVAIKLVEAIIT